MRALALAAGLLAVCGCSDSGSSDGQSAGGAAGSSGHDGTGGGGTSSTGGSAGAAGTAGKAGAVGTGGSTGVAGTAGAAGAGGAGAGGENASGYGPCTNANECSVSGSTCSSKYGCQPPCANSDACPAPTDGSSPLMDCVGGHCVLSCLPGVNTCPGNLSCDTNSDFCVVP